MSSKSLKLQELRVKVRCLTYEAKIIREMENKWLRKSKKASLKQKTNVVDNCWSHYHNLHQHRKMIVRPASRAANIAHGYLTGKSLAEVEQSWYENSYCSGGFNVSYGFELLWEEVVRLVMKFGPPSRLTKEMIEQKVYAWRDEHPIFKRGLKFGLPQSNIQRRKRSPDYKPRTLEQWEAIKAAKG